MGLISLFNSMKASYIIGRAISMFNKKKFIEAIELFKKAISLDVSLNNNESVHSYIGRSYLEINEFDYASTHLNTSYSLYKKNKVVFKTDYDRKEYVITLEAYRAVLEKLDQMSRAEEIRNEISLINNERD